MYEMYVYKGLEGCISNSEECLHLSVGKASGSGKDEKGLYLVTPYSILLLLCVFLFLIISRYYFYNKK